MIESKVDGYRLHNAKFAKVLLLYICIAATFLLIVAFNRRGYQDSWILQDIFVPTIVFVAVSLVFLILNNDNRLTAAIGSVFLITLFIIPGVKYELFYGTFDAAGHYGLIQSTISSGSVPQVGGYAEYYSGIPGMHVFWSSLSILSGISVNTLLQFIFPLLNGVVPLLVYFAIKPVFNNLVKKYIIILSSFPILGYFGYIFAGTSFAIMLFISYVAILLRLPSQKNGIRSYCLLLILISFSTIISHSFEPFLLVVFLVTPPIAYAIFNRIGLKSISNIKSPYFPLKSYANKFLIVFMLVVTWWTLHATYYLNSLVNTVSHIGTTHLGPVVPGRLLQIPLLAQVEVLLIGYALDFALIALAVVGFCLFVIILRRHELEKKVIAFYTLIIVFFIDIVLIILGQFAGNVGNIAGYRFFVYLNILNIFFAGFCLANLHQRISKYGRLSKYKAFIMVIVCFVIICFGMIQVFPFQPLTPSANVISNSLPASEYLFDFRQVNTIYKVSLVSFAQQYSPTNASIASDVTTRFQIQAFANTSFYNRHIWFSPLLNNTVNWNIFLLQTSDKAGPFNEPAEYRSPLNIASFRENGTVVYDNGLSIIIQKP